MDTIRLCNGTNGHGQSNGNGHVPQPARAFSPEGLTPLETELYAVLSADELKPAAIARRAGKNCNAHVYAALKSLVTKGHAERCQRGGYRRLSSPRSAASSPRLADPCLSSTGLAEVLAHLAAAIAAAGPIDVSLIHGGLVARLTVRPAGSERTRPGPLEAEGEGGGQLSEMEADALQALAEGGKLSGPKIAEKAGYAYETPLKSALAGLRRRGLVRNESPGYVITEAGRALLVARVAGEPIGD